MSALYSTPRRGGETRPWRVFADALRPDASSAATQGGAGRIATLTALAAYIACTLFGNSPAHLCASERVVSRGGIHLAMYARISALTEASVAMCKFPCK